jgi:lysozyme
MEASKNCAKFIAGFEGGQSKDGLFHPYFDKTGRVWTIGYGHTSGVGPKSRPLTKKQATALLLHDINHAYAPAVNAQLHAYHVRRFLNQNQFDALVSLAYNLGPGILAPTHTIGEKLKARDWKGVAAAFELYVFSGRVKLAGLVRRRKAERALFEKPVPKKKGKK